jgi:malonyl-CoA O-methyltransferase
MSNWKESVARSFDKKASSYGAYNAVQKQVAGRLMDFLPDAPLHSILEIGCGDGALTAMLAERYPQSDIVAIDISPAMIKEARINVPKAHFAVMDGEAPVMDKKFDLVISNMTAQWFCDVNATYQKWLGLLNNHGLILSSRTGPDCFSEWRKALQICDLPSGLLDFQLSNHEVIRERLSIDYGSTLSFLKTIQQTGALIARDGYSPLSVDALRRACAACDAQHGGKISWEIVYERLTA